MKLLELKDFSIAVHCPTINVTNNLRIVEDNGDRMNSKVLFACSESTTIIGESSITCLPSGRWSDNVPTCNGKIEFFEFYTDKTNVNLVMFQRLNVPI